MSDITAPSLSFETLLDAIQNLDLPHKRELFDRLDSWIIDAEEHDTDPTSQVESEADPADDYQPLWAMFRNSIE